MLFDLRGTGRRRTVKLVYVALAVIFVLGSLIGIGSGYDLGDVFGGGGGSANDQFSKQEQALEKRVQRNPQDADTWARLAQVRYQSVTSGGGYDSRSQRFSAEGRKGLREVDQAWSRYLALDPGRPNADVAAVMVNAYVIGLNDPAKAAAAQEIVAEARPSAAAFQQLAQLSYLAGQTRKGDLAAERALAGTPKDLRASVKEQLDAAKQQAAQQAGQAGAGGAASGGTPPTGTAPGG